jgi:site-specific DNA recombinase
VRVSHSEEKQHHNDAVGRIQAEYDRFQIRIDEIYIDKLDGRIDTGFFDREAVEWRDKQQKCQELIRDHRDANQTYFDEGIRLLELAQKAGRLLPQQSSAEKRRLLGFVPANCTWKDARLAAAYRRPFLLLAKNENAFETKKQTEGRRSLISDIWLPGTPSPLNSKILLTFDFINVSRNIVEGGR